MVYNPYNRRILENMTVDLIGPDNAINQNLLESLGHPPSQKAPSWMGANFAHPMEGVDTGPSELGVRTGMESLPSPTQARGDQMYGQMQQDPMQQYMDMGSQLAQQIYNDQGSLDNAYELSVAARTGKSVGDVLNEQKARRITAMNALTNEINSQIAMNNSRLAAIKAQKESIPNDIQIAEWAYGGDSPAQMALRQKIEKGSNQTALNEKIDTLVRETGVDRATATKIATGAIRVGQDAGGYPVTVDLTENGTVDTSNYNGLPMADTVDQADQMAEVQLSNDVPKRVNRFSTPIEQDMFDASGMWTRAGEGVMAGLGAMGVHPPQGDRVREATNRVNLFNNRVLEALAPVSKGDSVSVYALQRAQQLIRDPASMWNDPQRAMQDYAELRDNLESLLDEYFLISPNDVDKETWNKYRDKIVRLKTIIRMMGPRPMNTDFTGMSEEQADAAADSLPSGTQFIGPDGVKRRKP